MCDELYEKVAERIQQPTYKNKIFFCTDGNDQNTNAMLKQYNKDCIRYGQIIKDRVNQKVIGSHPRRILGNPDFDKISINKIDGFCGKLRERIACFVRKGKSFAKKRKHIVDIMHIFQAVHNFVEKKKGITPAMQEGLLHKPLSWSKLLHLRLPYA